jgi:hypothetical protein
MNIAYIDIKTQNTTQLISRIKKGLPLNMFAQLCSDLGVPEKELCRILKIPPSTLAGVRRAGSSPLKNRACLSYKQTL